MANLVNLQLDKDTGKFKVGTATGPGPGPIASGYTHIQSIAATTWTISHGASNTNLIYKLFDDSFSEVFPDSFTIVDPNTVQVTFGAAMTGRVHIVFFTP